MWLTHAPINIICATFFLWFMVLFGLSYVSQLYFRLWTRLRRQRALVAAEIPMIVGDDQELGKDTVFRMTVITQQVTTQAPGVTHEQDEEASQRRQITRMEETTNLQDTNVTKRTTRQQQPVPNVSRGLSTHRTGKTSSQFV
ncbi:hypothetical protein M3Y94_01314800 [Aphelenchoides besseyi]|nr:hypothetical protein M3Y94_01314800 [Aphelenchoides besseyi]